MNRTSIALIDTAKQQSRCVCYALRTTIERERSYSTSAASTSKAQVPSSGPPADKYGRTTDPNNFTYSSSAYYYRPTPRKQPAQSIPTPQSKSPNLALKSRSRGLPIPAVLRAPFSRDGSTVKTPVAPRRSRQTVPPAEAGKVSSATAKTRISKAPPPFRLRRERAIKKFAAFIEKQYGEQYQVRVFGSTCYGASSGGLSDIDITIFDSERPYGIEPGDERQLPNIYSVDRLARRLEKHGYLKVSSIAKASVPIVKCTEPETGVTFDVNVNNRLGVYNTALLRQYCLLDPKLPYFLKVVKLWMHSKGLNNASGSCGPPSFSSYAITIMTIALFQHYGLLPNLQADKESILQTHFWEKRGGVRRKVDIRFGACKRWQPPKFPRQLRLWDWLDFWANRFDFSKRMVSIADGGFVDRPAEVPDIWGPPLPNTANVVVLDPLTFKNCTHVISSQTLAKFKQECMDMLNRMTMNRAWSAAVESHVALVADPAKSDRAMQKLYHIFHTEGR
ncbi:Nucleotidyltransferase [Cubamyces sp. BRFM 1775]|nr:Nucleotidyltransferase [Cubamyces sp. BRFM 1775]